VHGGRGADVDQERDLDPHQLDAEQLHWAVPPWPLGLLGLLGLLVLLVLPILCIPPMPLKPLIPLISSR
jgi:hypothetical protein